jgi:tryptophan-rich sensory protein
MAPTLPHASHPHDRRLAAWAAIIVATLSVAVLGGLASGGESDPWYQALNKAPGTPPGIVFAVVWPLLYTLMALGAGLAWNGAGGWKRADDALGVFFCQLIANLGWTVLFFAQHAPVAALIDIVALWVLVLLMMMAFAKHSLVAAQLQIPYLLWLTFAAYLNGYAVFAN